MINSGETGNIQNINCPIIGDLFDKNGDYYETFVRDSSDGEVVEFNVSLGEKGASSGYIECYYEGAGYQLVIIRDGNPLSFPFNYIEDSMVILVNPDDLPLVSDVLNGINELGIRAFIPIDDSSSPDIEC